MATIEETETPSVALTFQVLGKTAMEGEMVVSGKFPRRADQAH